MGANSVSSGDVLQFFNLRNLLTNARIQQNALRMGVAACVSGPGWAMVVNSFPDAIGKVPGEKEILGLPVVIDPKVPRDMIGVVIRRGIKDDS
jgi:hypothetical protein